MNQVEHTETSSYNTQHQQWMMNIHKQVKYKLQLTNICLQENMTKHSQSMTQNEYMTEMVNSIIDKDIGNK